MSYTLPPRCPGVTAAPGVVIEATTPTPSYLLGPTSHWIGSSRGGSDCVTSPIFCPPSACPLILSSDCVIYSGSAALVNSNIQINDSITVALEKIDVVLGAAVAGVGDMLLNTIQTVTALKTFEDGTFALRNVADTFSITFTNAALADRVVTIQDGSGTLAYLSDLNTYTHNQTIPALQWDINHGLNRYPSVTAVDTAGYEIETQVRYIDANNVQVNCNEVTAGKGYLN